MKLFGLAMIAVGVVITAVGGHTTQVHSRATTVVVQRGQTLWEICSKHDPQGMDVREYVFEVEQANQLRDDDTLQPGEILRLP